jgi:hypothetical protein
MAPAMSATRAVPLTMVPFEQTLATPRGPKLSGATTT